MCPITLIFKDKERLPYGSNSRGQFIPPEKGRRAIFVPSFGTMEKEEIKEIVQIAQEQEDERIKKVGISPTKRKLMLVTEATLKAKPGERVKAAKEAIEELKNKRR